MDELEGGWSGGFKSVNFHDYSSLHPSVIKPSNILGGKTMPLEAKDTKKNTGLSQEYRESLYDSQMSGAERIKTAVIDLAVMAAKENPRVYPSDKLGLFNVIAEIADSLDCMRVSFNELYDAYCEMTAE